ncbi:TetR/AcrR family transcriptional regulator [Pseudonocardia sp. WMMC193]|uniref:TetR/AcrR family transcriptional regulator n=1 Tax=Pseudonocardia sp. WMMC193 TaxID=2911965 RepID=UPI001F2A741C|nr:TetR/AcrR family transcriptional regulator [Pseudonocardia sp. WMMC193]MCF7550807.1 TetR/AcrR family transcriptional regulator [Pseudonocardia sp. WMMC193]
MELFARRGFHAVGIDDIGAAAGVTGPAVYRHFPSKEAILRELCNTAMTELLNGARRAADAGSPRSVLDGLIVMHAGFAAHNRRLIGVYVREHRALSTASLRALRRRQREYEGFWVDALRQVRSDVDPARARGTVTAVLSLLYSAAHMPADLDDTAVESLLADAAAVLLNSPAAPSARAIPQPPR